MGRVKILPKNNKLKFSVLIVGFHFFLQFYQFSESVNLFLIKSFCMIKNSLQFL